ncbi:hypothetical protein ACFCX0_39475 [Streptomyces sp. NPDC056352]|uniref:hypothetical protein n=1 Tax=Streptomyces sp. NPDC056352 TaxID=3345791 RepID=UPI0035DA9E4E
MTLGEWVVAEGAIHDSYDEPRHVVDELPPMRRYRLGVHYGTSNPPSAPGGTRWLRVEGRCGTRSACTGERRRLQPMSWAYADDSVRVPGHVVDHARHSRACHIPPGCLV